MGQRPCTAELSWAERSCICKAAGWVWVCVCVGVFATLCVTIAPPAMTAHLHSSTSEESSVLFKNLSHQQKAQGSPRRRRVVAVPLVYYIYIYICICMLCVHAEQCEQVKQIQLVSADQTRRGSVEWNQWLLPVKSHYLREEGKRGEGKSITVCVCEIRREGVAGRPRPTLHHRCSHERAARFNVRWAVVIYSLTRTTSLSLLPICLSLYPSL